MANGIINGTTSSQYCICKIEWSSVPDVFTNTSLVTASLYYKRINSYTTYGEDWSFAISIDGKETSVSGVAMTIKQDWVLALTATETVEHDNDGTKTIMISSSGGNTGTSVSRTTCSETVELDNILRAAVITTALDVDLGQSCSIGWVPASVDYSYRLRFSCLGWSFETEMIYPGTTDPYVFTGYKLPMDELAPLITGNPPVANVNVAISTYNGVTQIGNENEKTFTVTVPNDENTRPVPNMRLVAITPIENIYIQGKSKIKASFDGQAKYGAEIVNYSFSVEGKSYENPHETDYLSQSGDLVVKGTVTDSRGYSGTEEIPIYVLPYSSPKVKVEICGRCDESENLSDEGTHLRIKASREYSKLIMDGEQHNFCDILYRYKTSSEESEYGLWNTWIDGDWLQTDISDGLAPNAELAVNASYLVQIAVEDTVGELKHTTFLLPTAKAYWHRDGKRRSFTFGGYVEEDNTFAIAEDIAFKAMGGIASLGLYDEKDFHDLTSRTGYFYGTRTPEEAGCSNYPVNEAGVLFVTSIKKEKVHHLFCTDSGKRYFQSWTPDSGWSAVIKL